MHNQILEGFAVYFLVPDAIHAGIVSSTIFLTAGSLDNATTKIFNSATLLCRMANVEFYNCKFQKTIVKRVLKEPTLNQQ